VSVEDHPDPAAEFVGHQIGNGLVGERRKQDPNVARIDIELSSEFVQRDGHPGTVGRRRSAGKCCGTSRRPTGGGA